jgi:acyl carrier protein
MLAKLGEIALQRNLNCIDIPFVSSKKNRPAIRFLDSVGLTYRETSYGITKFRFPPNVAAAIVYNPDQSSSVAVVKEQTPGNANEHIGENFFAQGDTPALNKIANELNSVEQILNLISPEKQARPELKTDFLSPRSAIEKQVAKIWAEALGVAEVGIHDNFFDLGGHSLMAVQIASRLNKEFGVEVPVVDLFDKPTVSTLADLLTKYLNKDVEDKAAEAALYNESIARGKRRRHKERRTADSGGRT